MSSLRTSIKKALNDKDEVVKKTITISLNEETISDLDKISRKFTELNGAKTISRNYLIESAINNYIEEAKKVLIEEYEVKIEDIGDESEEMVQADFNTVIFPAHNEGFDQTFLGEDCWYSVRIREDKIPKLDYVGIYRAAPVSAITHYAKIDRIEQYKDTNKKIIYFKDKAIKLSTPVKLGDSNANSMRSPRYTTKERLLRATEVKNLF